ncbi:hypothetical protein ACTWP4_06810 [Gracilibacillus sp. D59]|uniref:hypothetical protein n=1 Tax=Gracilibacillus sp. D59 TaxID=3457434 RepID=UPI003FCE517E
MSTRVKGAIYLPAQAYNAYQMWRDYRIDEIVRDLEFAKKLNLNALRVWLSYEYWLEEPEKMQEVFDHFLEEAEKKGIRILPSLFEKVGIEPTFEARIDKNPLTAVCVYSPSMEIINNPNRWNEPAAFVKWFMQHYRDDERLLAVEVMNEPYGVDRLQFAREMLICAKERKGKLPLTIGCIDFEHNMYFLDIGIDILQNHANFPNSIDYIEKRLAQFEEFGKILNKPVWLTEWQRIRPTSNGWGQNPLGNGEWQPDYEAYAKVLENYPQLGTFFWSLMVKPAYLPPQRKKGTLNGVFHEDGAVWSLDDARAIANDPNFEAEERREWPEWAKEIPENVFVK